MKSAVQITTGTFSNNLASANGLLTYNNINKIYYRSLSRISVIDSGINSPLNWIFRLLSPKDKTERVAYDMGGLIK